MRMDVLIIFFAVYALVIIVAGGKFAADGFFKKDRTSNEEFIKMLRELEEMREKNKEELRKMRLRRQI